MSLIVLNESDSLVSPSSLNQSQALVAHVATPLLQQRRSELIALSVGGQRFESTRETLSRAPYFLSLLRDAFLPPADGVYHIDKAPQPFVLILEYLREGFEGMSWSDEAWDDIGLLAAVGRDATFYGCTELADFILKWNNCLREIPALSAEAINTYCKWIESAEGKPGSIFFNLPSPTIQYGSLSFASHKRSDVQKRFDAAKIWLRTAVRTELERAESTDTIVSSLVNAGAHIEFTDNLLHLAARKQYLETVRALIIRGVNVNAQQADGKTALHAVLKSTEEFFVNHDSMNTVILIVTALLDAGADFTLYDSSGNVARYYCYPHPCLLNTFLDSRGVGGSS
jgi:hypothetical protein